MKYYRVNKKNKKKIKREKMRNRRLIKEYPWLMPRNVFSDKVPDDYDYTYVNWYGWPEGWNKAFGDMFLKEIGEAVNKAGLEKTFRIFEMKEKYGQLRCYTSGSTDEIEYIIDKYSHLSENICVGCGRPDVPMINDGWYSPWCFTCFKRNWKERDKYRKVPKNSTDEEIKEAYEKCICEDGDYSMADTYSIVQFSKDGKNTMTYDISETAEKIRYNWYKKHKNEN